MPNETKNRLQKWTLTLFGVGALVLGTACERVSDAKGAETAKELDRKESRTMNRDVESLQDAEQVWVRSLTTGDPKLLATLIDPEFTFIGPDGEYEERTAYLAGYEELPKMGVRVESIDIRDAKFRVLGNVAIATGRVIAKLYVQANPMTEDVRFTRVYQRAERGWRMVAGQGTRIAAAPPGAHPSTNGG